ncbi:MAG: DNA translocase FtsK 4TM domain-containing protein [Candidatus Staskawiczbacteria bacterium]|nr:DNA translocase FtsK 4TM domain-containing protein [Candidatus Staskawiczbacteria bacterium]
MSKKNKKNNKENKEDYFGGFETPNISKRFSDLHPETKKTTFGVIFLALGILTALSSFKLAGRFGEFFLAIFTSLLGYGFYLIPLVLFIIALMFLLSHRPNLYFSLIFGSVIFLVSILALLEIYGHNSKEFGGYVGFIIAYPLQVIFDRIGSSVILVATLLVSLALIFNLHFKRLLGFQEDENGKLVKPKKEIKTKKDSREEEGEFETVQVEDLSKATEGTAKKKDDGRSKIGEPVYRMLRQKFQWVMPPFSLLIKGADKPEAGDVKAYSNIIQKTLADFGIPVEMNEINTGPTVTQYTLKPSQGVKLAKITALANDLSLALAAHPLRIEAPIPGKSLVGIEIPNKNITTVRTRNLLERDEFLKNPTPLLYPLGIDVSGNPSYVDLASMPHLLICGSTGSGKSAAIHNILTAFLYKNSPEVLKLVLIDPKKVELVFYSDVPHLISGVINNAKDAVLALRFMAKEMDRRYEILAVKRVRDINSYNAHLKEDEELMPYIVVVVDELADLMLTYPREVEASIVRLAQMARAVGIHLIISTQRPSVEVITGLIKANITSRMAFAVASQIDSRTMIDCSGAEKLLGRGDMLFVSSANPKPKRIQGSYITEDEVKKVTGHLEGLNIQMKDDVQQNLSDFLSKAKIETEGNGPVNVDFGDGGDDDDLYEEAKKVVLEAGKGSDSFLQRRLRIGYARAARLLDLMERDGVISGADGAKPRMVLRDSFDAEFENREGGIEETQI